MEAKKVESCSLKQKATLPAQAGHCRREAQDGGSAGHRGGMALLAEGGTGCGRDLRCQLAFGISLSLVAFQNGRMARTGEMVWKQRCPKSRLATDAGEIVGDTGAFPPRITASNLVD